MNNQEPEHAGLTQNLLAQVLDFLPVGVGIVGVDLRVLALNRAARRLLALPAELFTGGLPRFTEIVGYGAQCGEFEVGDPEALTAAIVEGTRMMETHHSRHTRPDGTVLDMRCNLLPGGGFVTIWTKLTALELAENPVPDRAPGSDPTGPARSGQAFQQGNRELEELNRTLEAAQAQLLQSERMASIGQLAAGVAHEINNPVGYVISNFSSLKEYMADLFRVVTAFEAIEALVPDGEQRIEALRRIKQEVDLDFLKEDVKQLLEESGDGLTRVRKIVQDLKEFSHVGARHQWEWTNLHAGLDSTLNIVSNEIKYKANVIKQYGRLPDVECLPSELNQVFMNLLVNAAHAITGERGTITIRTGCEGDEVWVEVTDDGCGIAKENLSRIFDPFFTTKPVGKGTGLGLSLSYGIVKKHGGRIEVMSEFGQGTTFRVSLPRKRVGS